MSINLLNQSRMGGTIQGGMTQFGPMHKIGLLGGIRPQTAPSTGVNNMDTPREHNNIGVGGSRHKRGAGFLSNILALPSGLLRNIGLGKGGRKGHLNPGLRAYLEKKKKEKSGGAVPMPGGRKGHLNPGLRAYLEKKKKEKGGAVPMPGGKKGGRKRGGFWGLLAQAVLPSLIPTLINKAIPDAQGSGRRRRKAGTAGVYYG